MENGDGFLSRIRSALRKTSEKISISIAGGKVDNRLLRGLEETLILADVGVETAERLVSGIAGRKFSSGNEEEIKQFLANEISALLKPYESDFFQREFTTIPHILLLAGVNGNGKTTTAAKMAHIFKKSGRRPLLVAADTFRAAATEQLAHWAEKIGVDISVGREKADPAGLVYGSIERAKRENHQVVIVDTAGRLHHRDDLLAELGKIKRVAAKFDPTAPHCTILVLDGMTGQAAHHQVGTFLEKVGIDGLAVTKLDGSAKGGAVVALTQKYKLPILAVGVGEGPDDLRPFRAQEYAAAILG
jgi:fused signal recognition particle receptor